MKVAQIEAKLIDCMGTDLSVVNAARVSFDKESEWDIFKLETAKQVKGFSPLQERDIKLITYLAKHKHFSPFNHTFLTFRVKAPIFVARQLVKHKFMPWNEVSRRYVDSEPEFYIPEVLRAKSENVKQGSAEEGVQNNHLYLSCLKDSTEDALSTYESLLAGGVCPEQARMVLPQNTMTEFIWSGTLGAWCDMLRLRLDPHTQTESRMVAQLIRPQIEEKFPVSTRALLDGV